MTKIIKFRIWNYKSIKDSGDCYPSPGVTVFAGKNESGKTSILEALEDFNEGTPIREKARPIGATQNDKPKIAVTFEVLNDDLKEIFEAIGVGSEKVPSSKITVTLEKHYPADYVLTNDSAKVLKLRDEDPKQDIINDVLKHLH